MIRSFILLAVLAVAPSLGARLPYIVNGKDVAVPGTYPYQCSLQTIWNSHSCGCAIISANYVLSAAHCISTYMGSVVVGLHNLKITQGTFQGKPVRHGIQWYMKNPGYGKGTGLNEADISILKVSSSIDLNGQYAKAISLPDVSDGQFVDASCVITGWGNTQIGSTGAPDILQEANTKPLSLSVCQQKIKGHPYFSERDVVASHICIGGQGSNFAGSCHGDSGGPLACTHNGRQLLAGVTSWGSPDCNPKWPTMYTRITSFRSWIKANTGV